MLAERNLLGLPGTSAERVMEVAITYEQVAATDSTFTDSAVTDSVYIIIISFMFIINVICFMYIIIFICFWCYILKS